MKSLAAAPRHRQWQIVVTACLAVALMAGQAVSGDDHRAPIDLSAFVHEAVLPGGTIFEDTHSVTGAFTTPKQSAEYLYLASKGENLSGRSTNIQGAFASALAESDGNGGVGVTAWIGGSPSNTNPAAIGQLVSQATWKQNFTYNGTIPASISLHLHIPALQVGLIGVPPNRDSFSATETAEAKATLTATIIHPDFSTSPGASFRVRTARIRTAACDPPRRFRQLRGCPIPRRQQQHGLLVQFVQGQRRPLQPKVQSGLGVHGRKAGHASAGRHRELHLPAHRAGHHAWRRARVCGLPRRPVRSGGDLGQSHPEHLVRARARVMDAQRDRAGMHRRGGRRPSGDAHDLSLSHARARPVASDVGDDQSDRVGPLRVPPRLPRSYAVSPNGPSVVFTQTA